MNNKSQEFHRGAAAIAAGTAVLLALVALPNTAPAAQPAPPPPPTLYGFGDNHYGQLGIQSGVGTDAPQPVTAVTLPSIGPGTGGLSTKVAAVAAGGAASLVLTKGGNLYAYGDNHDGQLGNTSGNGADTPDHNATPVALPATAGPAAAITAGNGHSLVATTTGALFAFGGNADGQLGTTANTGPNPTPSLVHFGGFPIFARAQPKVVAVAAGASDSFALGADGALYAFGSNSFGQLGTSTDLGGSDPVPTRVVLPGENGTVTQVAAGSDFTLALTSSGQLYSFGDNDHGQLGVPGLPLESATPTLVTLRGQQGAVTQVAAGGAHTLVLTATGQLYSFGLNNLGQLGGSEGLHTVGANPQPTLVSMPSAAGPVRQISASASSSWVLTANGTLYAFGDNAVGQLGDPASAGASSSSPVPITLPGGARIESLARGANSEHMLVAVSDLAVSTTTLVSGRVGAPYSQTLAATGGFAPYSFAAVGLPRGLSISSAGAIAGTPLAAGTASVVVTVTDANGIEASSGPISLTVAAASATSTTTTPTSSNPASAATLRARLRSELAPQVTIGKLLRTGAYRLRLHGLVSGAVTVRWQHRGSSHGSPVLVVAGSARATAGSFVVTLHLTRAGRRLLAHAKQLRLSVSATLTPSASPAISVTRTATLVRKKASS